PGHEFAGAVVGLGPDVQAAYVGMRCVIFPMLPCGHCSNCQVGLYNLCKQYDYFGSRRDGGFEEYLVVPEWNLVPIPDSLPIWLAALCEPLAVALHAINRCGVSLGERVGIAGAGPIGLMAARAAMLGGASQVVLWDIDPTKLAFSRELGNEHTLDATQDLSAYLQQYGGGLDAVVEGTGSAQGLAACIGVLKSRGRLVLLGNPGSDITLAKEAYWKLMRNEISLYGTWNSAYLKELRNDWQTAVDLLNRDQEWFGRLISHRFTLEDGAAPLHMMAERKEFFCKVLYSIDPTL
ncbi:MAG: zinc-binding dehydrogenase, partial [Angelakisella sp.]